MGDPATPTAAPVLSLVGLIGGEWFGRSAGAALASSAVVTGDRRHLDTLPETVTTTRRDAPAPVSRWLDSIEQWLAQGEAVCAVVSGDPGFFGLVRLAAPRFGERLRIYPAPSSVSLAFSRAGISWDDALVVSAHGRPKGPAVRAVAAHPKVAVLCSPDYPPEALAKDLITEGCAPREVLVASRLGENDERCWTGDVSSLAEGEFDGLSVVIARSPARATDDRGVTWGRPEEQFEHREGMITKSEVRAVALGKLGIPAAGVMWDVGAGSGSVALECSALSPGMRIFAVERRPDDVARMRLNLAGTSVTVVEGEAPTAMMGLPDPDRVFIGGGGPGVLAAALKRLRPGGRVVATFASFGRAAHAAELLGNVVQVSVGRGVPSGGDGSFRLQAENPVFVCWGPK